MKQFSIFTTLLLALSAKGNPIPDSQGVSNGYPSGSPNARVIYFMSNAAQNSIVALKVAADGTLSDGSITQTGGAGGSGITKATGKQAGPDALFSQGAVAVAGHHLVVVNPGSNTVSMFKINQQDPTKLKMVGQPVDVLGEFPISVAVSQKLQQACVATTGVKNGIACFSMCAETGLTALDQTLRPFGLNQTTPPQGPTNTVSQTFFNADSSALITTVKGDPSVNNTGFLSIFPIENDVVATKDVRSSPAGTAVLFGTVLLPHSNSIFTTDASFGSATIAIANNMGTTTASTKIAGQAATCWSTFSALTGSAFVTDVGVNHLVEIDTTSGSILGALNLTNGNPGMIDLKAAGKFIYSLSPGNATVKSAVTVFDVSGGQGTAKQIQNFNPAGVTSSAQGMAVAM